MITEKRNSDELETNRERLGRPSDKDDTAERLAERFLRDFDAEYRRRLKEGEERSVGN